MCPRLMSLVSRDGVGVNDVGVKGVRDAKESVCFLRGFGLRDGLVVPVAGVVVVAFNGGVAYKACHRRTMSPCPVVGESPVKGVSPVVPVVEASFNLCPVLPVNGLLEDKTKVHVAGASIVVCSRL